MVSIIVCYTAIYSTTWIDTFLTLKLNPQTRRQIEIYHSRHQSDMDSTGVCCDNLWWRHRIPAKKLVHNSIRWAFSIKHQQRATSWMVSTQAFYVAPQSPGYDVSIQQGDIRWMYYLKEIIYSCTFVVPFCKWGRYFYDLQMVRGRTRTLAFHYNKP